VLQAPILIFERAQLLRVANLHAAVLRAECLNASWFETIDQARRTIEAWRLDYNSRRPHGSLGQLSPREYRQRWTSQQGAAIEAQL
jgi:transposase InsO family protein